MKKTNLHWLLGAILLNSCAHIPTANVPLSFAKLDTGYLNSGIYDLGQVFVWDRDQKTLTALTPLKISESLRERGSRIAQQKTSLSTGTDIELAGTFPQTASADVKGAITRSTTTELNNVAWERTDAEEVLNLDNKATHEWRRRLSRDYSGDNFRFVVINRILRGDKVDVGFKSSTGASAGANVIQLPGTNFKFAVTYNGENSFTQSGNDVPLVLQVSLFKLTGTSEDPQFAPLTGVEATQFNFQKAIKSAR